MPPKDYLLDYSDSLCCIGLKDIFGFLVLFDWFVKRMDNGIYGLSHQVFVGFYLLVSNDEFVLEEFYGTVGMSYFIVTFLLLGWILASLLLCPFTQCVS